MSKLQAIGRSRDQSLLAEILTDEILRENWPLITTCIKRKSYFGAYALRFLCEEHSKLIREMMTSRELASGLVQELVPVLIEIIGKKIREKDLFYVYQENTYLVWVLEQVRRSCSPIEIKRLDLSSVFADYLTALSLHQRKVEGSYPSHPWLARVLDTMEAFLALIPENVSCPPKMKSFFKQLYLEKTVSYGREHMMRRMERIARILQIDLSSEQTEF